MACSVFPSEEGRRIVFLVGWGRIGIERNSTAGRSSTVQQTAAQLAASQLLLQTGLVGSLLSCPAPREHARWACHEWTHISSLRLSGSRIFFVECGKDRGRVLVGLGGRRGRARRPVQRGSGWKGFKQ